MQILFEKKKKIQERLQEVEAVRNSKVGDISDVITKREELQKKIAEKVAERTKLRDDHKAAMNEYKQWQNEQRRIRNEKWQEEKKAQQEAYKLQKMAKEVEKLDDNPYVSQITLIEQTVQFCKGLLPKEEEEAKEEKKETVHTNKEGEVVLGKKEDRANEFYFAPTKKKGGAKKANKPAEEKTKKQLSIMLRHSSCSILWGLKHQSLL